MVAATGTAWAGTITGSAHDLSTQGWSGGQICIACHTPHGGGASEADAPLWNHDITVKTYTLYNGATRKSGPLAQPAAVSKLCLSCHDGTVGPDSFGGGPGATATLDRKAFGVHALGSLAKDHPVGFVYNTELAAADGALFDPSTKMVEIGSGGTKTEFGTIAAMMLFNGQVECASCHDVHNGFTASNGRNAGAPLLRITLAGSAICLACHNK
jgi:mono/diheme cytochrome c family protein